MTEETKENPKSSTTTKTIYRARVDKLDLNLDFFNTSTLPEPLKTIWENRLIRGMWLNAPFTPTTLQREKLSKGNFNLQELTEKKLSRFKESSLGDFSWLEGEITPELSAIARQVALLPRHLRQYIKIPSMRYGSLRNDCLMSIVGKRIYDAMVKSFKDNTEMIPAYAKTEEKQQTSGDTVRVIPEEVNDYKWVHVDRDNSVDFAAFG